MSGIKDLLNNFQAIIGFHEDSRLMNYDHHPILSSITPMMKTPLFRTLAFILSNSDVKFEWPRSRRKALSLSWWTALSARSWTGIHWISWGEEWQGLMFSMSRRPSHPEPLHIPFWAWSNPKVPGSKSIASSLKIIGLNMWIPTIVNYHSHQLFEVWFVWSFFEL